LTFVESTTAKLTEDIKNSAMTNRSTEEAEITFQLSLMLYRS
jgi:hypothetical protein